MAAYDVDIQLSVKNLRTLDTLQRKLKEIEEVSKRLTGAKADPVAINSLKKEIALEEEVISQP